jgi:hypothetical protein
VGKPAFVARGRREAAEKAMVARPATLRLGSGQAEDPGAAWAQPGFAEAMPGGVSTAIRRGRPREHNEAGMVLSVTAAESW